MGNLAYTEGKARLLGKATAINPLTDTLKARLCMTNTTCDTEQDKATLSAFTTLDTYDGAGYADVTLTTKTIETDEPNNRGEFHADDVLFAALAVGTRSAQGMLLYKFVTNDTDSIPICWIEPTGFPVAGNGGDVKVKMNAEGWFQLT